MPNRNSLDRFAQTTLPSLLHMTAHRSLVRSQYRHPEADSDVDVLDAMSSTAARDGCERARIGPKMEEGISSSAANWSACFSRPLPLPQPSMSLRLHIASSWPGRTKWPISCASVKILRPGERILALIAISARGIPFGRTSTPSQSKRISSLTLIFSRRATSKTSGTSLMARVCRSALAYAPPILKSALVLAILAFDTFQQFPFQPINCLLILRAHFLFCITK